MDTACSTATTCQATGSIELCTTELLNIPPATWGHVGGVLHGLGCLHRPSINPLVKAVLACPALA